MDAAGFFFDYYHGTYVNKRLRVIMSHQFNDSLNAEELGACVSKIVPRPEWQFLCLKPPLPAARRQLEYRYS